MSSLGILVVSLPLLFIITLLGSMWRAWWVYPAWGWFIVPLGLPAISFWHFTALLLIVSILTTNIDDKKDDRETDWIKLFMVFVWPIFVWILLWWMR